LRCFADHVGYRAIQALAGVRPVLAGVFVAEIGDGSRPMLMPAIQRVKGRVGRSPRAVTADDGYVEHDFCAVRVRSITIPARG
jgi:hypothetical protein